MTTLTETQSLILSRAATRPGNRALPLPDSLRGGAAAKVVEALLAKGLVEEVEANIRRNEPLWRETGDGHGTTLLATEAGLCAVGIEPLVASAVANAQKAKPKPEPAETPDDTDTAKSAAIRPGTKQAQIIAMLQRPEGASIAEIVAATSWQAHTARGAISGALKKKLGLTITSEKVRDRGRIYRIED